MRRSDHRTKECYLWGERPLYLEASQRTRPLWYLLAAVAYEQSPGLAGKRVRWSVHGPRRVHGLQPEKVPMDTQTVRQEGCDDPAAYRFERFTITRQG